MNTKLCKGCAKELPTEQFYAHPKTKDRLMATCKECTKAGVKRNYLQNREHYIEYERGRGKQDYRKKQRAETQQKYRKDNPEKYKARSAVGNALRDGRLSKQPCVICGDVKVEAHHEDHLKPLEVTWLCRKHHLQTHNKVLFN